MIEDINNEYDELDDEEMEKLMQNSYLLVFQCE